MIRALILDFDGLILETEIPDYDAWREVYESYGAALPLSAWEDVIGQQMADSGFDPIANLEQQIGRPLDKQLVGRQHEQRYMPRVLAEPIMPGVERLISDARQRQLRLAIASSSHADWVNGHLNRLALAAHFDVIKTADDVKRTKPDPALYLEALKSLDISPHEAVVFEDSPNGVKAAKRAGIFVVAVPTPITERFDLTDADMIIPTLADLSLDDLTQRANGYRD